MLPVTTILALSTILLKLASCSNIFMITMGGTKSHKIPFWELARGLIARGHNITFMSAFPADFVTPGLEEITPAGLVFYVKNFTNWDLVGSKMRGEQPIPPIDVLRYGYEACDMLLSDPETKEFIYTKQSFDLLILDGAYPECAMGFVHRFKAPFMYIHTVGFYSVTLSLAGNPTPFSVTPFFALPFTDNMNLLQKTQNTIMHVSGLILHTIMVKGFVQGILREHFGKDVPPIYETAKNVSFILQNAYASVTYPRAYLPNVAEIACIHCKDPKPLPADLEKFIEGSGDAGFIFVSMGSSVKAANVPENLRRLFLHVFRQLPQRVLWKWEASDYMPDLPPNVRLGRWLPQQDLLGHKKIRAFVTHGGLLSMFETIYHGVPIVTLPVFCDHDSNAAKAELDGYAIKLDLGTMTADSLLNSIKKVIYDSKYRRQVKKRQILLKDQKESPLEKAIYWTEYVLRHKGAIHFQSSARDLSAIQYYLIDVAILLLFITWIVWQIFKILLAIIYALLTTKISFKIFKKKID